MSLLVQVHLIGHSAGGWLGRAFVADPLYFDSPTGDMGVPNQGVASLVTLGTPHLPKPATEGRDMTGGALTWVNLQWPGNSYCSLLLTCTHCTVGEKKHSFLSYSCQSPSVCLQVHILLRRVWVTFVFVGML